MDDQRALAAVGRLTRDELAAFLKRRGFAVRRYETKDELLLAAEKHAIQNPHEDPNRPVGSWS